MGDVQPLNVIRYDPRSVGSLDAVVAPPYDVIDAARRAELLRRSPFNVVEVDLPQADGGDPYLHAQTVFQSWLQECVLVRDREPAFWVLRQDFGVPGTGERRSRTGFFARVRVEDYGAGSIRPHERTQPGPKEDRLRLTRATRANLSAVFSLFDDPSAAATDLIERATAAEPIATFAAPDGGDCALWRVAAGEPDTDLTAALSDSELLIADGHHRYETARAYAEEVGGEGPHRYVLMFLCPLSDPGLTVLPTHRLLTDLKDPRVQEALGAALKRDFEVERTGPDALVPAPDEPGIRFGYMDAHFRQPFALTLKDRAVADAALEGSPESYRQVEAAVLEALVLRGVLGMSQDDVAAKRGLDYSSDLLEARRAVEEGRCDAAFFLRATPVERVREVAAAGVPMPPKSTFFYPKVPTGIVFNPLE